MSIYFPRSLLREKTHSWNIQSSIATSGVSGDSVAGVVSSDGGGFWACTMSDISLSGLCGQTGYTKQGYLSKDRQKISTLLWRAVRQGAKGGAVAVVVPRHDDLFVPWPAGAARGNPVDQPHSDLTFFSDGTGYVQSTIAVTTEGAASLRATTLVLNLLNCGPLNGGESFSINHPDVGYRLYEIATVFYSNPGRAIVTFNPPLRGDVVDNTDVEFDRPSCTMRLTNGNSMDLTVQPWTFNSASVQFIEAFE